MLQVSRLTGGQVYKYTYFQADLDGERFIADLRHNISRWGFIWYLLRIHTLQKKSSVVDPDPGSEVFPSLIPDPHQSIFTQKNDV
jgi:hypothetical protein